MIKGINHVGMSVENLERAIAFYRDVFGMTLVCHAAMHDNEQYDVIMALKGVRVAGAMLRLNDLQVELFEFDTPRAKPGDRHRPVCDQGITHFCLEVTEIEREYRRMKAAGVAFHCPPLTFGSGNKATYGRDPDGNVFELWEDVVAKTKMADARA